MGSNADLPPKQSARLTGLTVGQAIAVALGGGVAIGALVLEPERALAVVTIALWLVFSVAGLWRATLLFTKPSQEAAAASAITLPRYTVVAALRHEAGMIDQVVGRLARLDYPAGRLEGFLALEADDADTIAAARRADRPAWLELLIVPPGQPMTKPRALNHALDHATGDLITVYDAEDEPAPNQLLEAAFRFADGSERLACLQAPLRIRRRPGAPTPFLDRQFAAEYAALFEVVLPAHAQLGLPFPLGGTSNHFRTDVLRAVGGWDAYNVTEDADLGFRLWRRGYRLGVLASPTWESPPGGLDRWLPQRTRWLKGFMQTWGVQMRAPLGLGWRGQLAMQATLGQAILSAALYAPALLTVLFLAGVSIDAGGLVIPPAALGVLGWSALLAWATCLVGARRAGVPYGPIDMIQAPIYWSLMTMAFVHAVWRLIRQPHAWDKTEHTPDDHEAGRSGG